MHVTAIVPTFNRSALLDDAVRSLLAQTEPPDVIIVVDDGSDDDTESVVNRLGAKVRYLHQANAGKAAALNHAMEGLETDAVWIFDDDDLAHPDALLQLKGALHAVPEAALSFGRHDVFRITKRGAKVTSHRPFPTNLPDDFAFQLLNNCFCFQGAMLVRLDAYRAVGPFDFSFSRSQDYDMMLRLVGRNRAVFVDAVIFHQRAHAAPRGPAQDRIAQDALPERQLAFDARAIRQAYRDYPLDRYLPQGQRPTDAQFEVDPADMRLALLRRASVVGRRRMWAEAAADVASAFAIAPAPLSAKEKSHEYALLGRILDRGTADIEQGDLDRLIRALRGGTDVSVAKACVGALLWPFMRDGFKDIFRSKLYAGVRKIIAFIKMAGIGQFGAGLVRTAVWGRALARNRHRLLPEL